MALYSIRSQKGVTLLEIILVIVIATSLILLGFQQYLSFQLDRDAARFKYNLDILFDGLKGYYQTNCRTAMLAPTAGSSVPILMTDLTPFLSQSPLPYTPFVTNPGTTGYVVQLNRMNSTRNISTCFNGVCSPAQPIIAANTVTIWLSQVAIQVTDIAAANRLLGLLGADCISSMSTSGAYVEPCSNPARTINDYLVWQRLPSAVSDSSSNLWLSMPLVKQFTQQYTNDDNYAFNIDDTNYNNLTGYRNYLCGG